MLAPETLFSANSLVWRISLANRLVRVGVAGFEPATPSSRTRCAAKTSVLNLLGPSGRDLASFVADNASFVSAPAAQRRRGSVDRNVNANRKLKGSSEAIVDNCSDFYGGPHRSKPTLFRVRNDHVLPHILLGWIKPVRPPAGDRYDRGLEKPASQPKKGPSKADRPETRAGLAGGIPQWTNRGNGWLWLARIVC